MSSGLPHPPGLDDGLGYPFFQTVFDRKSRRMGLGMSMPGTLGYDSPYEAVPLTELEEALLLVVGTGLTGLNLGDIDPSMGADAMVQWTARTWPSSCSISSSVWSFVSGTKRQKKRIASTEKPA